MADDTPAEAEGQAEGERNGRRSAGRIARDAAVEQTVATLAYIGVTVLVSVAILKRDALWRLWRRVSTRPTPPDEVAERFALAELRRDISAIEHRERPAAPRPRGLYETW